MNLDLKKHRSRTLRLNGDIQSIACKLYLDHTTKHTSFAEYLAMIQGLHKSKI